MGTVAELERLLETVRFRPPPVLPSGPRGPPPLPPHPQTVEILLAVAAVGCVMVLLFVFWRALLQLST